VAPAEDLIFGEGMSITWSCSLITETILYYRSVHNVRIERLWVDVTTQVGSTWADHFTTLESGGHEMVDFAGPSLTFAPPGVTIRQLGLGTTSRSHVTSSREDQEP